MRTGLTQLTKACAISARSGWAQTVQWASCRVWLITCFPAARLPVFRLGLFACMPALLASPLGYDHGQVGTDRGHLLQAFGDELLLDGQHVRGYAVIVHRLFFCV